MADPEVKIKVSANTDQAKAALSGLNKSWIGLNSALDLGKKAAQFLGEAYNALVGDTQEHAQSVLKMTRISGQSAEMTSRMIELTDDFGIAQETLSLAMRNATTKGIAFTTDKLAEMSDEYLKLKPGIEQAQYASEMFGARAGAEMQKLLEKGSQAIRDQAASIDEHMLMTEEDLKASEDLRIAQDNLNDSMTAVGRTIGKELIPRLATAADTAYLLMTRWQKLYDLLGQHNDEMKTSGATYEDYRAEMIRAAQAAGLIVTEEKGMLQVERQVTNNKRIAITDFRILSQAEYENADAIAEADRRLMQWGQTVRTTTNTDIPNNNAAIDAMGARYQAQADLIVKKTGEAAAAIRGELAGAIRDVQSANEAWASGAGGDLASMLEGAGLSGGELNQALIEVDKAMGTNYYTAKLQKEALQKMVDQLDRTGDVDAFGESLARLKNGGFQQLQEGAVLARVRVQELYAELKKLDGQTATAYVNVISGEGGGTMTRETPAPRPAGGYDPTDYDAAGGANFVVPPGYPNDTYRMGLSSGERVVVTPAGQTTNMGGITININGAGNPHAVANAVALKLASYGKQYQGA